MKELSLLVKQRRGDIGLRTAAEEIGITHTTLSRVEAGNIPDLTTFTKLCKWLEVDPNDILGVQAPNTISPILLMPVAHYRAQKTMGPDTAQGLGTLIMRIHEAASQRIV